MILLDSEGINAVTAEGQNDNQIFTLTVLLASVLIYNSKGVPKRNDLNDLKYLLIFVCVRDRFAYFFTAALPLSSPNPCSCRVYLFLLIRISFYDKKYP